MKRWLRRRSPWHGVRHMVLVETLSGTLACCCAARPGRCLRCVLGLHNRCSRPGYVMLGAMIENIVAVVISVACVLALLVALVWMTLRD